MAGGGCFWCLLRVGQDTQYGTSSHFHGSKRQREEELGVFIGLLLKDIALVSTWSFCVLFG